MHPSQHCPLLGAWLPSPCLQVQCVRTQSTLCLKARRMLLRNASSHHSSLEPFSASLSHKNRNHLFWDEAEFVHLTLILDSTFTPLSLAYWTTVLASAVILETCHPWPCAFGSPSAGMTLSQMSTGLNTLGLWSDVALLVTNALGNYTSLLVPLKIQCFFSSLIITTT